MAIVTELGLPEFGSLADDLIGPATSAEFVAEGLEHRGVVFPPGTIVAVCPERAKPEPVFYTRLTLPTKREV